jgi:hypothetical protein
VTLRFALLSTLLLLPLGRTALAQDPVHREPSPLPPPLSIYAEQFTSDSAQTFERPNGMLLRPGSFVYQLAARRDTLLIPLGIRTVHVTESSTGGAPGWLIAESRTGSAVTTSDSLYLARADLSPERWVAASGQAQLAASFSRDSMFGAMQTYQGRASFVHPLPVGALLTPGMVERIVEMLPLHAGYRASATLVFLEMGAPRTVPADLLVEREESVTLADRAMDCWVVLLRAGLLEERLWVSKEAPRVLKTEQATGSGILTAVLQP